MVNGIPAYFVFDEDVWFLQIKDISYSTMITSCHITFAASITYLNYYIQMCTSLRHSLSMVLFYDVQWLWFYITEILVKVALSTIIFILLYDLSVV